jgi:hypothetical protein
MPYGSDDTTGKYWRPRFIAQKQGEDPAKCYIYQYEVNTLFTYDLAEAKILIWDTVSEQMLNVDVRLIRPWRCGPQFGNDLAHLAVVVVRVSEQRKKSQIDSFNLLAKGFGSVKQDIMPTRAQRFRREKHWIDMPSQGSHRYKNPTHIFLSFFSIRRKEHSSRKR